MSDALKEAAEEYLSHPMNPYDPESAFLAGAAYAREEILKLLKEEKSFGSDYSDWQWAEWLETKLK